VRAEENLFSFLRAGCGGGGKKKAASNEAAGRAFVCAGVFRVAVGWQGGCAGGSKKDRSTLRLGRDEQGEESEDDD
jgi:hypothetical protein